MLEEENKRRTLLEIKREPVRTKVFAIRLSVFKLVKPQIELGNSACKADAAAMPYGLSTNTGNNRVGVPIAWFRQPGNCGQGRPRPQAYRLL